LAKAAESSAPSVLEGQAVRADAPGSHADLASATSPTTDNASALGRTEAPTRTNEAAAPDKAATATLRHEPPLSAERAADVLRQIRLQLTPQMREAVIQLEPREMGRIAIKVSVTRGVVKAEMRAEKRSTLEALERHAPELKSALERVGLSTNGLALQLGFDGSSTPGGGADSNANSKSKRASFGDASVLSPASPALGALARRVVDASGVDTYA